MKVIDLGAGTGRFSRKLQETFPKANIYAFDLSYRMMLASRKRHGNIHCVQGNFNNMPFGSNSIDIIYSNFSLQWSLDLPQAFSELTRILKNKGYLLFSIPGPSTLFELKNAFGKIDSYTHINDFYSIHTLIQFLEEQHFKIINTHTEYFKLHFEDMFTLLKHLKLCGANSLINNSPHSKIAKNLITSHKIAALSNAYHDYLENNLFPTTYETFIFIVQKRSD